MVECIHSALKMLRPRGIAGSCPATGTKKKQYSYSYPCYVDEENGNALKNLWRFERNLVSQHIANVSHPKGCAGSNPAISEFKVALSMSSFGGGLQNRIHRCNSCSDLQQRVIAQSRWLQCILRHKQSINSNASNVCWRLIMFETWCSLQFKQL